MKDILGKFDNHFISSLILFNYFTSTRLKTRSIAEKTQNIYVCIYSFKERIRVENAEQNLSLQSVVAIVFSEHSPHYIRVAIAYDSALQSFPCVAMKFTPTGSRSFTRVGIICIIARSRTLQLRFLLRGLFSDCSERRKFQFNHSLQITWIIVAIMILPTSLRYY